MKVLVIGLGYVGLSNAVLLSRHNQVIGVDISVKRLIYSTIRSLLFLIMK